MLDGSCEEDDSAVGVLDVSILTLSEVSPVLYLGVSTDSVVFINAINREYGIRGKRVLHYE